MAGWPRPLDRGRLCDALRQACPWLGGDPSLPALVSLLAEPRRVKPVHLHHGYLVRSREAEELGSPTGRDANVWRSTAGSVSMT